MKILTYPDPKLAIKADPIEYVNDTIRALIDTMHQIVRKEEALGLAATQIGVPVRLFVYNTHGTSTAIINPELTFDKNDSSTVDIEGCLSVVGYTSKVIRSHHVKVKGLNKYGVEKMFDAYGILARVIQHEVDHLDGILFIDRISRIKRNIYKRKLKKLMRK